MSTSDGRASPLAALGGATVLGVFGLFVGTALGLIAIVGLRTLITVQQGSALANAVALMAQGAGLFVVGAVYLSMRELPLSYLRARWPSARDVGWAVASTVGLFAVLALLTVLIQQLGLSATEHSVAEAGRENPALLLPLIPLSVLVTGPAEEFLYRGVIQTRLTEAFDARVAVVLAALLFSLVHVPAYGLGSGLDWALATTLAVLFVLGFVLGGVYELTDNLVVPAVAHGIYNAVVFGQLYAQSAGII